MVISDGPRVVISGYFSCSKLVISDFAELATLIISDSDLSPAYLLQC